MHWIAFGDIHENTSALDLIPNLAEAEAVIITGDITNRGGRESVDRVIRAVSEINPRILALPGNMDTSNVHDYLSQRGMNFHLDVRELAPGIGLMGVGQSPPTPFNTPGEVPDETIGRWLDETHARAGQFDKLIVPVHVPPYNTKTDMLNDGEHVGSPLVRAFLKRTQPDLVLTGHIHESRAVDTIGRTLVLNPGMLAGGGFIRIELEDGKLTAKLLEV